MLGAARIAGIMAAKRTHELIPLCHPLAITKVAVDIEPDDALPGFACSATAKVTGQTGVEMEALTAVSVACLTLYDMVKAVERGMRIEGIRLVEKRGGKSGTLSGARSRYGAVAVGRRRARSRARRRRAAAAEDAPLARPMAACWPQMSLRCARSRLRRLRHGRLCGARRRRGIGAGDAQDHRRGRRRPPFAGEVHSGEAARIFTGGGCRPAPTPSSSRRTPARDGERVALSTEPLTGRAAYPPGRPRFQRPATCC